MLHPWAPAFMTTAPPTDPGIPAANSSPASPRWEARRLRCGRLAPHSATTRQPAHPAVGDQDVAAAPEDDEVLPVLVQPPDHGLQVRERRGEHQDVGGPADPEGDVAGQGLPEADASGTQPLQLGHERLTHGSSPAARAPAASAPPAPRRPSTRPPRRW